ncbi:hypothetical protein H0H93_005129 [Arthromyces matolae]|nr:hypothetical protein H0H93_005129 [Arthromyces matolae]
MPHYRQRPQPVYQWVPALPFYMAQGYQHFSQTEFPQSASFHLHSSRRRRQNSEPPPFIPIVPVFGADATDLHRPVIPPPPEGYRRAHSRPQTAIQRPVIPPPPPQYRMPIAQPVWPQSSHQRRPSTSQRSHHGYANPTFANQFINGEHYTFNSSEPVVTANVQPARGGEFSGRELRTLQQRRAESTVSGQHANQAPDAASHSQPLHHHNENDPRHHASSSRHPINRTPLPANPSRHLSTAPSNDHNNHELRARNTTASPESSTRPLESSPTSPSSFELLGFPSLFSPGQFDNPHPLPPETLVASREPSSLGTETDSPQTISAATSQTTPASNSHISPSGSSDLHPRPARKKAPKAITIYPFRSLIPESYPPYEPAHNPLPPFPESLRKALEQRSTPISPTPADPVTSNTTTTIPSMLQQQSTPITSTPAAPATSNATTYVPIMLQQQSTPITPTPAAPTTPNATTSRLGRAKERLGRLFSRRKAERSALPEPASAPATTQNFSLPGYTSIGQLMTTEQLMAYCSSQLHGASVPNSPVPHVDPAVPQSQPTPGQVTTTVLQNPPQTSPIVSQAQSPQQPAASVLNSPFSQSSSIYDISIFDILQPPPENQPPTASPLNTSSPSTSFNVLSSIRSSDQHAHPPTNLGHPPSSPHPSQIQPQAQPRQPPRVVFNNKSGNSYFLMSSPHPVVYENVTYPTAAHLLEALKFLPEYPEIARRIRKAKSPFDAAMISNENPAFVGPSFVSDMTGSAFKVLDLKFRQHADLRYYMCDLDDDTEIIFDDSDEFWGVGRDGNGGNHLGKVLQRVKRELKPRRSSF